MCRYAENATNLDIPISHIFTYKYVTKYVIGKIYYLYLKINKYIYIKGIYWRLHNPLLGPCRRTVLSDINIPSPKTKIYRLKKVSPGTFSTKIYCDR